VQGTAYAAQKGQNDLNLIRTMAGTVLIVFTFSDAFLVDYKQQPSTNISSGIYLYIFTDSVTVVLFLYSVWNL